ncbi:MAG TPA: hypothetical protein VK550_29325 [Polyangiaceae bacterium]|jgi:hypothetical protein|nr:hypothetical protein [Polyangiaceae bacterium]
MSKVTRLPGLASALIAIAIVAPSCAGDPGQTKEGDPDLDLQAAAVRSTGTLVRTYGAAEGAGSTTYTIRTESHVNAKETLIHSSVRNASNTELFRTTFTTLWPAATNVQPSVVLHWTWLTTMTSGYLNLGQLGTATPTLPNANRLTYMLLRQIPQSDTMPPLDTTGCTLGGAAQYTSCSEVGKCCDKHDQCYADNNCTQKSWTGTSEGAACIGCNITVVACWAMTIAGPQGPSDCCKMENCDQPQCEAIGSHKMVDGHPVTCDPMKCVWGRSCDAQYACNPHPGEAADNCATHCGPVYARGPFLTNYFDSQNNVTFAKFECLSAIAPLQQGER